MRATYALVLTPELQDLLPSLISAEECKRVARASRTAPVQYARPVQVAVVDEPTLFAIERAADTFSQALLRDVEESGITDTTRRARCYAANLVREQANRVGVAVASARATPVGGDAARV